MGRGRAGGLSRAVCAEGAPAPLSVLSVGGPSEEKETFVSPSSPK